MRLFSAVLAVALPVTIAFASAQDEKKNKDDARVMVVQGCVNRSRLDVMRVERHGNGTSTTIDHFHLRGNKDLMKVLTKDLNGHHVEVTGVVDDPHNTQGRGKTIQVGKNTTITTGARDVPDLPDPAIDATLTVESFKDLEPHCHAGSD